MDAKSWLEAAKGGQPVEELMARVGLGAAPPASSQELLHQAASEYEAHLQLPAADQATARHAAEARRVEAAAVAAIVEAAAGPDALADDVASAPAPDAAIWALGSVRSLAAYEDFSGVDFTAMRVGAQAERGGMPSDGCFWDRFACLHAMLEAATPNGSGADADDARAA